MCNRLTALIKLQYSIVPEGVLLSWVLMLNCKYQKTIVFSPVKASCAKAEDEAEFDLNGLIAIYVNAPRVGMIQSPSHF